MPLTFATESPDSLQTLLKKAEAIACINSENLDFIESRKGEKVILKNQYRLEIQTPTKKKRKWNDDTQHKSTSNVNDYSDKNKKNWKFSCKKIMKPVVDVIEGWKYTGESFTSETIAFDHFIELELSKYDDLSRLNNDFIRLHNKYSRVLIDQKESLIAARILLDNLERLQVAIGDIHMQTLDVKDPVEGNESVTQHIEALAREVLLLGEKISEVDIVFKKEEEEDSEIVDFQDLKALLCKHTFKHTPNTQINAMKAFSLEGKEYMACAVENGNTILWDLMSKTISSTLTDNAYGVMALEAYKHKGLQMLAIGSGDGKIKLWNFSNKCIVSTLPSHGASISSMSTYENDGEIFLVSAYHDIDTCIKIWDVENHVLSATLEGHEDAVNHIQTFNLDHVPYLASGHQDGLIRIWNLKTKVLVKKLQSKVEDDIEALDVIDYNGEARLACGYRDGAIEIWDLKNYSCKVLLSSTEANNSNVTDLKFVYQGDKLCLISGHFDGKLILWNVEDRSLMKMLSTSKRSRFTTFKIGGKSCLIIGKYDGTIDIWMECDS